MPAIDDEIEALTEDQRSVDVGTHMTLSKLLSGINVSKIFQTNYGRMVVTHDVEIRSIQYDSRRVERGDLFVALRGSVNDGNIFITDAIGKGAHAVMTDMDNALSDSYFMHSGVVKVVVPDARAALGQMSSTYYGNPSEKLAMIGVTGTNGKTTTTYVIKALQETRGIKTGLVGTINYQIGDEVFPATHTTPESLELHQLLARMVENGCASAVMEVSSHALDQHRVQGIGFRVAVFTNLTQDHLDYHGSMEKYFDAKKILFDSLGPDACAVINVDDEWGKKLSLSVHSKKITYGMDPSAAVSAGEIELSLKGARFSVLHGNVTTRIESSLMGRFNVSNLLASFAAGLALGIPEETICQVFRSIKPVRGRFEQLHSPRGWTAVIDYAHTPDALEKVLMAVKEILRASTDGRIITVFGCGGNRDRTKRPVMGRIASELSDVTIVTSDNPRHEEQETIIDEIMIGIGKKDQISREADRAKAVRMALDLARKGDIVLVAGKGHEEYQVIGNTKIHFSDREIVEEYLRTTA